MIFVRMGKCLQVNARRQVSILQRILKEATRRLLFSPLSFTAIRISRVSFLFYIARHSAHYALAVYSVRLLNRLRELRSIQAVASDK